MSSKDRNCLVYIRGFSKRTVKEDIKDTFRKYGKIRDINMKNGYAFVVNI